MFAQQGTFTVNRVDMDPEKLRGPVDGRAVPEVLKESIERQMDQLHEFGPVMYHITAPTNVAKELLYLLSREGITRHQLFPDYAEIIESLREEWLYAKLE